MSNTSPSTFTIPTPQAQDANIAGENSLIIADNSVAESGFAYLNAPKIDLATTDFSFTYNITTGSWSNWGTSDDYGSAFMFYNDNYRGPYYNSDYGELGIYGTRTNNVAIRNAIVVEFDNRDSSGVTGDSGRTDADVDTGSSSHIAVTYPYRINPDGTRDTTWVTHEQSTVRTLSTPYANNSINTARITWTLTNPGATDSLTDNIYTLTYYYYQGVASATGTPTATASVSYTYAQMIQRFGGTSQVNVGLSGSTAALINKKQTLSFPTTYPYTNNYYIQRADGTRTAITAYPQKTGTLPLGPGDVGPLPANTAALTLVGATGPGTSAPDLYGNVTIAATGNTFNYYYRDDAPVFSAGGVPQSGTPATITPATATRGAAFDPRSGVAVTDVRDDSLALGGYKSYTVSAPTPTGSTPAGGVTANPDGTYTFTRTGTYSITYTATDSVGNVTTVTRVITVLASPPTINPITEPATSVSGTTEPGVSVTITWPASAAYPAGTTSTVTADSTGKWTAPVPNGGVLLAGQVVSATTTGLTGDTSAAAQATVQAVTQTTQISAVWVDPLATAYPDTTVQLNQNGSAYGSAITLTQATSTAGKTVSVSSLPTYYATQTSPYYTQHQYSLTATAPSGYVATTSGPLSATSLSTGFTVTYTRILATATMTKTDAATGEALSGAGYTLYRSDGTVFATELETNADGVVTFSNIPSGSYYLAETTAPDGYRLPTASSTTYAFTVPADGTNAAPAFTFAASDYPIVTSLPNAGSWGSLPFWIVGAAFLLAAALSTLSPEGETQNWRHSASNRTRTRAVRFSTRTKEK